MHLANDWKKTARGQALEVLEEVFQEGAYSNIALNAHLSKSHLTDKDKALVTEIVMSSRTVTSLNLGSMTYCF